MRVIRSILAAACLVAAVASAAAQITYDTVAQYLAGQDNSGNTDVFTRGYLQVADGGGGWFTKTATSGCNTAYPHGVNFGAGSQTISMADGTAGILVGMGVTDPDGYIPNQTYVTAVMGYSITISNDPMGSGTKITVSGGNGGSIIGDIAGDCFARVQPNTDVHASGAKCDVQVVQGSGATWDATDGAIRIPTANLPTPNPAAGQYITVTQIGDPPMWADRWSALTSTGSGYVAGDVVSFRGHPTHGQFSQQLAIVVDQVGSTGAITKWRFISGGQYTSLPTTSAGNQLDQDIDHSCTGGVSGSACKQTGSGAEFLPAWSGWSVLDHGSAVPMGDGGSDYSPGDIVTLDSGGTLTDTHYPQIVVMNTNPTTGAVTSFEWLDYGSYSSLGTGNLTQHSATCINPDCAGLQIAPEWTRGPLATTIASIGSDGSGNTLIYLTDTPAGVPDGMPIEAFYYGDDDGVNIASALVNSPNAQAVHVTGYCGTTIPLNLPDLPGSSTPANAVFAGDDYKTGGIFAFAPPLSQRGYGAGRTPIMNHVVSGSGKKLAFGGGMRDLEIEGGGVPQGTGYYYFSTTTPYDPPGYDGPEPECTTTSDPTTYVCVPYSGSVVEIDGAKEAFFTNLAVYDAYGEGNAEFQSGFADADPTAAFSQDFGSVFLNGDRFAVIFNQAGALDPEYALEFEGAHDSQFSNLIAFDGTEADVFQQKGNIYSGLHVESDVLNGAHGPNAPATIPWGTIGPLAGVATYGFESLENVDAFSNMQCDTAWRACVYLGGSEGNSSDTPSTVTNIAQKCSGFVNVWPTYYGVELAAGLSGTAVSNVAGAPSCAIPSAQLVHLDGPTDPSVQTVFQDPGTQTCTPSPGYQSGRYYTTPFTATANLTPVADTLYAIPVRIACGVTVTSLSTYVTAAGAGSLCRYGIYDSNGAGQPNALLLDAGSVPTNSSGVASITIAPPQKLSPGLVFLVVDCGTLLTGMPTLDAGASGGGNLIGFDSPGAAAAVETASWTFNFALPTTFPSPITYAAGIAPPLVFFEP